MDSPAALPSQIRTWAQAFAPCPIIDVTQIGDGITGTKRLLLLADAEPLVIRWSDPQTWGATGREHVRREALALQLLATSTLPVPQLLAPARSAQSERPHLRRAELNYGIAS
jgi:hypothetical protein